MFSHALFFITLTKFIFLVKTFIISSLISFLHYSFDRMPSNHHPSFRTPAMLCLTSCQKELLPTNHSLVDVNGRGFLHRAIYAGNIQQVRELILDKHLNVNLRYGFDFCFNKSYKKSKTWWSEHCVFLVFRLLNFSVDFQTFYYFWNCVLA